MHQMSTIGFCLITNVPGHNEEEYLDAIKKFHSIPLEEKMKLALRHYVPGNKNIIHGYFPFLDKNVAHKEFYDMARPLSDISKWEREGCPLYEENAWPENSTQLGLDEVKVKFEQQFRVMQSLALKLIQYLAVGLGKDKAYFDPWFKDECTADLRAIHYKPRDPSVILDNPNEQKLTAPEHCDTGFITLLTTFNYPGLQVEIDGEYKSITPVKNAIVVNIGETLQKISNYRIKATRHRVLDIGVERYSAPYFLEPKHSARIGENILESSRKSCEDDEYDNAPENQEEISKLIPYASVMCSKVTGAYGEWKGFEIPHIKYDYSTKYN